MITILNPSGSGKTTVRRFIDKPFVEWEKKHRERYCAALQRYFSEHRIWEIKQKALARKFEHAVKADEDDEELSAALQAHISKKPSKPMQRRMYYSDITPRKLIQNLHDHGSEACIFEDEAARTLFGPAMADLGLVTKGWDGGDIVLDRQDADALHVHKPQVTMLLMIQNNIFDRFMEKRGQDASDIGLFARMLFTSPESTMGTRFIEPWMLTMKQEHVPQLHARLSELLEQADKLGDAEKPVLSFAPDAQDLWTKIYNAIESRICPGGTFEGHGAYASKIADNMARVAAILHVMNGEKNNIISLDTLDRADALMRWYADEYLRLFPVQNEVAIILKDAHQLETWFKNKFLHEPFQTITKRFVRQSCPNPIRDQERLRAALALLVRAERLYFRMEGRKQCIDLNVNYFNTVASGKIPFGYLSLDQCLPQSLFRAH